MYKCKVWNEERNNWLFQHQTEGHQELYRLFCEAFPDVETTPTGVANQRSRIGACAKKNPGNYSRKAKPLYSEQIKHGYVYIKVAQPSVWISKSKWVWCETHPWLINTVNDKDGFIFLDGNNRNFNPDNIEKVSLKEQAIINTDGPFPKNQPDLVRFRISKARLILATFDKGEELGLTYQTKKGRRFKSAASKYYQSHKNDEAYRQRVNENSKKYYRNMTEEQREHRRKLRRENYKKNKNSIEVKD